jgi:hypothetical protein
VSICVEIKANEEGSIGFGISVAGFDGVIGTPNSIDWTLTDTDKNVINSRTDVAATNLDLVTWILLEGDDLAIPGTDTERVLTLKILYDSVLGGISRNNVTENEQVEFDIKDLLMINP